nr:MAG TPA: hypothetical protein [Caudoviricetes sp.]
MTEHILNANIRLKTIKSTSKSTINCHILNL